MFQEDLESQLMDFLDAPHSTTSELLAEKDKVGCTTFLTAMKYLYFFQIHSMLTPLVH